MLEASNSEAEASGGRVGAFVRSDSQVVLLVRSALSTVYFFFHLSDGARVLFVT
jgi:hypothetical protein